MERLHFKLHVNMWHLPRERMIVKLRAAGARADVVIKYVHDEFACETCEKRQAEAPRRVAACPRTYAFKKIAGADIFYLSRRVPECGVWWNSPADGGDVHPLDGREPHAALQLLRRCGKPLPKAALVPPEGLKKWGVFNMWLLPAAPAAREGREAWRFREESGASRTGRGKWSGDHALPAGPPRDAHAFLQEFLWQLDSFCMYLSFKSKA